MDRRSSRGIRQRRISYRDWVPAPVPAGLRRALIEAMGGWGPFTVGQIVSLFDEHGFDESGEVEPEQGVRRTTAAELLEPIDWDDPDQRRRLSTLVDDVLDYYPEGPNDLPGTAGHRLRRAVERARGDPQARAQLVQPDGQYQRTTNLDDPFDLWPPGKIRLFFSHTSDHAPFVADVARALEEWPPFACFVAHEEIAPSLEWQAVIQSALESCHAMVAFLTDTFGASEWCDQEVGWAMGRSLVVIPVRVTANPRGFLGAVQAVPADQDPTRLARSIASAVMTAAFRETRPGAGMLRDPLADAIVEQFGRPASGQPIAARCRSSPRR